MNHFLLYLWVKETAASFEGCRIRSVRVLPPVFTMELIRGRRSDHLVVILSTPGPFLFRRPEDPLAGAGTPVFRRIHGMRLAPPPLPDDRVVRFPIVTEHEAATLAIYLHGSAARVRIQGTDHIVESLDPAETGMPIPPGFRQDHPPFARIAPGDLTRALASARELTNVAAGLDSELARLFTTKARKVDAEALIAFRDGLLAGGARFALGTSGRAGRVTPLPASTETTRVKHQWGPFDSIADGCATVGEVLVATARSAILAKHTAVLEKHSKTRRRLLEKLQAEHRDALSFEVGRNEADILAAFQTQIPTGAREIELPDLYAPGQMRKIVLDPAVPVHEQIQRRYKRAAKLERSRGVLARRIKVLERDVSRLGEVLKRAAGESSFHRSLELLVGAIETLGLLKVNAPRRTRETTGRRYRRFELGDHWFVLVGRSDQENDEITFRAASPGDIWMHAQQVAGSHIVLKSSIAGGNPPKKIMLAAAGIAAFYSKARHSKLVPVIHTKRKYVRKFRGARPGEVRCEREKTIFAEPGLPVESGGDDHEA